MEIAPGVDAVELMGARGYVILEDRLTLIDAGLPGSRVRLSRHLGRIGRSLAELERIICTHAHPDHVGGVRELASEGVEVLMHPADIAGVQVSLGEAVRRPSRGRLLAFVTPTPARLTPVADGEVLPVLGGLEVIHTPGHTPGSICLFAPRERLLFVGDVLEARRGRVTFASPIFSDDVSMARASVQRLAALNVETIVFGHYPPLRHDARGVLEGLAAQAADGRGGASRWRR